MIGLYDPFEKFVIVIGLNGVQFVFVLGLRAVQFGNNWMKKFRGQPKLDEAVGSVQFGSTRNFLNPIISKLDKHLVLLPINYIASKNDEHGKRLMESIQIFLKLDSLIKNYPI